MHALQSVYRVQLNAAFTLRDADKCIQYLDTLGITHLYCSPVFKATPGSAHGYDGVDFSEISAELGGEAVLRSLSQALHARGMGLIVDFVPNHMGMHLSNGWWRDVLEKGRASTHADTFDIEWENSATHADDRITLPVLSDHYGLLLESGALKLEFDGGDVFLAEGDLRLPLRDESYGRFVATVAPGGIAQGQIGSPGDYVRKRIGEDASARDRLAASVQAVAGRPGDPASFNALDEIVQEQHYRLARWQAGLHGTRYRRFFTINTLIGVRVETPHVFDAVHAKLAQLIRAGCLDGIRIDHLDGLRDPSEYLKKLRQLAVRPDGTPLPVFVEKILCGSERLPTDWETEGTTGYEFIHSLNSVCVDAVQEPAFNAIYQAFTGDSATCESHMLANKRLVVRELFRTTLHALARRLLMVLQIDRRWRDCTSSEIADALEAYCTCLGVYRTYRIRGPASDADRIEIAAATEKAVAEYPRLEPRLLRFVADILTGAYPEAGASAEHRDGIDAWVAAFQQHTGAIMAKGVEDTTFYTYNRLLSLNEVGCDPCDFGGDPRTLHRDNEHRLRTHPLCLVETSTHDTKLSEDVRARLNALSEIPHEWRQWLLLWRDLNAPAKTWINGRWAPDANEEYRLYQLLLGAWPEGAPEPTADFRLRIASTLRKSIEEAKIHTTLAVPNPEWHAAVERFVEEILQPDTEFVRSMRAAVSRIAGLGITNSLAQLVLKLCSPGTASIYQGNETWSFNLVDPDNRRSIDFGALETLASRVAAGSQSPRETAWATTEIKWRVTQAILHMRRRLPDLFSSGGYDPLSFSGRLESRAFGFLRRSKSDALAVIVPRLVATEPWPPVGPVWANTRVDLPATDGFWTDVISRRRIDSQNQASLSDLLQPFPIAVLHTSGARTQHTRG